MTNEGVASPVIPAKVGVIGCGAISAVYFEAGRKFEILDIVGCSDLDEERMRARASEFEIRRAAAADDLLNDPDIEIIINLTVPGAHAAVTLAALKAGKSVYSEKPLSVTMDEAEEIMEVARTNNLLVGCAPDTFLGGGHQTVRKLIDDGVIGEPVGATAFMMSRGVEGWHPNPDFYYKPGGGPMFDMGPYYLTALVNCLGPVRRVTGATRMTFPERTITTEARHGQKIPVEVPTHVAGLLDFHCGAVATIITSFDVWASELPRIEIYGTEGTISVPDPNGFGGPVRLRSAKSSDWEEVSLTHGYADNSRGVGAADMAYALRSGRKHRASEEMAFHVMEIMHAIHESSREGRHDELTSTCARPAALPVGLVDGELDE